MNGSMCAGKAVYANVSEHLICNDELGAFIAHADSRQCIWRKEQRASEINKLLTTD